MEIIIPFILGLAIGISIGRTISSYQRYRKLSRGPNKPIESLEGENRPSCLTKGEKSLRAELEASMEESIKDWNSYDQSPISYDSEKCKMGCEFGGCDCDN